MPRAPSQPFGAQATLEYSRERRQRKAKEKEAAAAEKARIQEWQKKLVRDRAGELIPTQKPLPELPAKQNEVGGGHQGGKMKKLFALGKKKNAHDAEEIDFNLVFGNPIDGPRETTGVDEGDLTALPQMPLEPVLSSRWSTDTDSSRERRTRKLIKMRKPKTRNKEAQAPDPEKKKMHVGKEMKQGKPRKQPKEDEQLITGMEGAFAAMFIATTEE